jgi:four helix bundle protein
MKSNLILDRSFDFALSIIELYKQLQEEKEFVLSKQVLRSGTSIGANVNESTAAFSRKDFAYRMTIASKEARETQYWLRLLHHSQLVAMDYQPFLSESEEIGRILTAIVKTTRSKTS